MRLHHGLQRRQVPTRVGGVPRGGRRGPVLRLRQRQRRRSGPGRGPARVRRVQRVGPLLALAQGPGGRVLPLRRREPGRVRVDGLYRCRRIRILPELGRSARPARSMLGSIVSVPPSVGQLSIDCHVFGPSGQTAHPKGGVTQGYTCRQLAEERHKSFIRLDAVDRSLVNSVHHFGLKEGFRTAKARSVRVNHYKYQAWDEFKLKFRRRASTYVADWTNTVNAGSRDRAPGLGFEAVEPAGWSQKFCEVNDTRLKDTNQKWFGAVGPSGEYRMAWE
uniref:Glycosyltransferase family 92 protein n=1 Tax=Ananas comosus var. bracteatus TaxID=296719 RepID=A0A6V7PID5_ANACO|nr:unnamed protein product [Ananas comosus var. bracteatus]